MILMSGGGGHCFDHVLLDRWGREGDGSLSVSYVEWFPWTGLDYWTTGLMRETVSTMH